MKPFATALVTLGALAAIVYVKSHAAPVASAAPVTDDEQDLVARCHGKYDTSACAVLHASVVTDAVDALEQLAWLNDRRAVPTALDAIKLDEPAVQAAALDVLVKYPEQPGVLGAVCPLLGSPYAMLVAPAGDMCMQSPDHELAAIAKQYRNANHTSAETSAYDDGPVLPALIADKLVVYPGAQHYWPGDGEGVFGYSTPDPIAKVARFYADHSKEKPLTFAAWRASGKAAATPQQAEADLKNDPDLIEMQQLAMKMGGGHVDRKAMARMQELQKKMQQKVMTAAARSNPGATSVAGPPTATGEASFQGFVLEKRGDVIVRAVAVYREDVLGRTVIQVVVNPAAMQP